MFGLNEILLILGVLAVAALFGRKAIMKLIKDGFAIKKDIEKMSKEDKK